MFRRGVTWGCNMRRPFGRVLPVIALMGLVTLAEACGRTDAKAPAAVPPPAAVTTVTVKVGDVPIVNELVGQTQSSHTVNIYARVSGFLERRVYTEGAIVKEGQTLFLMDPKPFQAQVEQAKAALAMQAATLANARANLERVKPLVELNALSRKDLDDATGQFQTAAASVEQAKAQLETAQLNLSYTTIVSPIAGITGAALQTEGTYIDATSQNSQLTTVMALSPIWVTFSVSENQYQWYTEGLRTGGLRGSREGIVDLVLVDGSIFPHRGTITFTSPSFDQKTGMYLLRASVDNPQGVLRPNQFVRARLKGLVRAHAILLPQRAVQQGPKGHFVWVVNHDNKAEQQPVVPGDWHDRDVFIEQGLQAGERVIVDGGLTLQPGQAVAPQPAR